MRFSWKPWVLLVVLTPCLRPISAQVHVWEGTLDLPTYEEGLPDPNPAFDEYATTRFFYPYTSRTNPTNHRVDRTWRAVYLENEYLKCSVLPDLGGRIYTCLDKISNQPMFYANPSVKKAEIATRGNWVAMGVEFNFPISHSWVTVSSVDFAFSNNSDGSASVTVGNIDNVYGMQWKVELILRPESTVLEQRVMLNNRSDVRHRFYWWSNAGVQAWGDSRIYYPMQFSASHGFVDVDTWPIDSSGTDLSIMGNHKTGPVSRFVYGSREPFMGVWSPHTDTGIAHYANYDELPAKKIWSWGVDADALDWRKALSDNDSAYMEVQGGLFRNQETWAFLEPRQTIKFSEYWMPVRGLGGIARANLDAVANISRQDNTLVTGLNLNHVFPDASIRILDGNKILFEEKSNLTPEHSWAHQLTSVDPSKKYTVELHDKNGILLLHQTEDEYDWTLKSEVKIGPKTTYRVPTSIADRTDDDWLQLGKDDELSGQLLVAMKDYREGLLKFPDSFALQVAAGRLAVAQLHYDEAIQHLEVAQRRETSNPEIAYYLGIAYDALGRKRKALTALETAERMPSFHAAADLLLGEYYARENDLESAADHLAEALRSTPDDIRTAEELVAIQHARGMKDVADALGKEWLNRYPTSYFLREDLGEPDLVHLAADTPRVLNIATEYMRLGLYKRAIDVLSRTYPAVAVDQSEPGSTLPQKNPLVLYCRGYCKNKLDQSSKEDYAFAASLSTEFVFPSGAATYEVLQAATQANEKDATAQYLLGTLQFSVGLADQGMQRWEQARQLNPKIPTLDANVGLAALRVQRDPQRALTIFEEGVINDPENIAIYTGLDQALSLMQRPPADRIAAIHRYPHASNLPSSLVFELALNKAEAGDFDGAIAVFRNRFFPREELGTNVREIWIEVLLQQALALSKAGKCDAALKSATDLGSAVTGLDFTKDGLLPFLTTSRTNHFLGMLEEQCGAAKEATAKFEQATHSNDPAQIVWALRAAKNLSGFDAAAWHQRLVAAVAQVEKNIEAGHNVTWWTYNAALLQQELSDPRAAKEGFNNTLLLPDEKMVYHLSRLALSRP